jgi:hypothetical protein
MLRKVAIILSRYQILSIILIPSVTTTVLHLIAFYLWDNLGMGEWIWTVMIAVFGLAIGLLLTVILKQTTKIFNKNLSWFLIIGWAFAFLVGKLAKDNLFFAIEQITDNYRLINLTVIPIESAIAGLIGSLITLDQLKISPNNRINWKTVLAGPLGFGLGNLLTNLIFGSYDDSIIILAQYSIWGLIGGTALAFPSRNYKRYLIFGLLGCIGMALGYLMWIVLGEPEGFEAIFIGATLGLFLSIGLRSVPSTLILLVIGISAYTFRRNIIDIYYASDLSMEPAMEYTILALSAGLFGMILGVVWSYLNDEKPTSSTQQVKKIPSHSL